MKVEFRMREGIAHVTLKGVQNALCNGAYTQRPAPAQAVPCARCMALATELLAQ